MDAGSSKDHYLAPYAVTSTNSRGRRYEEALGTSRSEFQRDRDRIIHCAAFRRLEYKTQVFVNHEGDHFRTRLTHSLEVSQIARSIARSLSLNEDLAEAIALAHDLGHTPFGHAGQDALNECMSAYGGFEHNLQSLRVVDQLEAKYADFPGLNLTFETREGVLKHCSRRNARQLGDVGERFLNKQQPGLEAQLTNLADEIAYNNHDVEDGLRAGMITIAQLCETRLFSDKHAEVVGKYPDLDERRMIHEINRRMISHLVSDLVQTSAARITELNPKDIDSVRNHSRPLVGFSESTAAQSQELKSFLREAVYRHYRVHRMSAKARRVIRELFREFLGDVQLLPTDYQQQAVAAREVDGDTGQARVIADYIAGMTDRYAILHYERLFNPGQLT